MDVVFSLRSANALWKNTSVREIGHLMRFEGPVRGGGAVACFPSPNTCDPEPANRVKDWMQVPSENSAPFGRHVFTVAAARLRFNALNKKKPTAAICSYFNDRQLHLTATLARKMSTRHLGLERGWHWLPRARCGAFVITERAVRAKLIPPLTGGRKCPVCMREGAKDPLHHFLFNCRQKRLVKLRKKAPLRKVAKAIVRCFRKHYPPGTIKPSGEWDEDDGAGHVNLLLGGQHGGASVGSQIPLSAIRPEDQELFNRVYRGQGWKSGKLRLAGAAMKATARFLHGAMPTRNRFLWASLFEDAAGPDQSDDPLDRSHDEG